MANNTIQVIIDAQMKIDQVKSSVSQLQNWFSKLDSTKLGDSVTQKLTQGFQDANREILNTEKALQQIKDNGLNKINLGNFDKGSTKAISSINTIIKTIKSVDPNILASAFKIDPTILQPFKQQIEDLQNKLQELGGGKNPILLIDEAFSQGGNSVQKYASSIQEIQELIASGNIDEARAKYEQLDKTLAKSNNTRTQLLQKMQEEKALMAENNIDKSGQIGIVKYENAAQLDATISKYSEAQKAVEGLRTALTLAFTSSSEQQELLQNIEQVKQKMSEAEQQARQTGASLGQQLASNVQTGTSAFRQQREEVNQIGQSYLSTTKQAEQLMNRFAQFTTLTGIFTILTRSIRTAFNAVKELDKAMNSIAVVTDMSTGDLWNQIDSYTDLANSTGSTIAGAYQVAQLYYQQGLDTTQVLEMTTETLKLARIASLDYAQATDYMTAAIKGFGLAYEDVSHVNDVFSNLAANTASSQQEIAIALSKVASLAHSANMELETTSAFLAQIIATTRESPETAGTALKTVVARFAEVKKLYTEGQLTGTDEEGEGIDINKIDTALKTAGMSLNKFVLGQQGLDEIFIELAERWDGLTTAQQRYIATQAAGSRQQSRFLALMQDYSGLMEVLGYATDSAGASQEQFDKTMESLESKLNNLKNAWTEFTTGIANQQIIKDIVDILQKIVNQINNLTDFGDTLGTSLARVALLFISLRTAGILLKNVASMLGIQLFMLGNNGGSLIKTFASLGTSLSAGSLGMKSLANNAINSNSSITLLQGGLQGYKVAIQNMTLGTLSGASALAAYAAIAAVVIGVVAYLAATIKTQNEQYKEAQQQAKLASKAAKESEESYNSLLETISNYDNAKEGLDTCIKGTQSWYEALQDVNQQAKELLNIYPELAEYANYDENGQLNFNKNNINGLDVISEQYKNQVRRSETTSMAANTWVELERFRKDNQLKEVENNIPTLISQEMRRQRKWTQYSSSGVGANVDELSNLFDGNIIDINALKANYTKYINENQINGIDIDELIDSITPDIEKYNSLLREQQNIYKGLASNLIYSNENLSHLDQSLKEGIINQSSDFLEDNLSKESNVRFAVGGYDAQAISDWNENALNTFESLQKLGQQHNYELQGTTKNELRNLYEAVTGQDASKMSREKIDKLLYQRTLTENFDKIIEGFADGFKNATVEQQKISGALFQGTGYGLNLNNAEKVMASKTEEELAAFLGTTVDNLKTLLGDDWFNSLIKKAEEAKANIEKISKEFDTFGTTFGELDKSDIADDQLALFKEQLENSRTIMGENNFNILSEHFNEITKNMDSEQIAKFVEEFNKIDFQSKESIDEFVQALVRLGIVDTSDVDKITAQLYDLAGAAASADLTTLISQIETLATIIKKVSDPDWDRTITEKDFEALSSDQRSGYTKNLDGGYTYIGENKKDAKRQLLNGFKSQFDSEIAKVDAFSNTNSFYQVIKDKESFSNNELNTFINILKQREGIQNLGIENLTPNVDISRLTNDQKRQILDDYLAIGDEMTNNNPFSQIGSQLAQALSPYELAQYIKGQSSLSELFTLIGFSEEQASELGQKYGDQTSNGLLDGIKARLIDSGLEDTFIWDSLLGNPKEYAETAANVLIAVQQAVKDGIDVNTLIDYAELLKKQSVGTDLQNADDALFMEMARTQINQQNAYDQGTEKITEWAQALDNADHQALGYITSLNEMINVMSQLTGLDPDNLKDWFSNLDTDEATKAMGLFQKALQGNGEALKELRKMASDKSIENLGEKLGKDNGWNANQIGRYTQQMQTLRDAAADAAEGLEEGANAMDNPEIMNYAQALATSLQDAGYKGEELQAAFQEGMQEVGVDVPVDFDIPAITLKGQTANWSTEWSDPNGGGSISGQTTFEVPNVEGNDRVVGTKSDSSNTNPPKKGGGGGGGKEAAKPKQDPFYNYIKTAEKYERTLKRLQNELEFLTNPKQIQENYAAQVSTIQGSLGTQASYLNALESSQAQLTDKITNKYSKYIQVGEDGVARLTDAYWKSSGSITESLDEIVDEFNDIRDKINENEEKIHELKTELKDLFESTRDSAIDLINQLADVFKENDEKIIKERQEFYEKMEEEDQKYLDSVKDALEEERKARERAENFEDLAKQQQKLALLQRDTSGMYANDIAQLEDEIKDKQQDLADNSIDDMIAKLEKQMEEEQQRHEEIIEAMEKQIESNEETRFYIANAEATIAAGEDAILAVLTGSDDYLKASDTERIVKIEDWEKLIGDTQYYNGLVVNGIDSAAKFINATIESEGTKVAAAVTQSVGWILEKMRGTSGDGSHGVDIVVETKVPEDSTASNTVYSTSVKRYKKGGLVNYTGPAWVDGTKSNPEAFLNPTQTAIIAQLAQNLTNPNFDSSVFGGNESVANNSECTINIDIGNLGADYDIESAIQKVKDEIVQNSQYRNVNLLTRRR